MEIKNEKIKNCGEFENVEERERVVAAEIGGESEVVL
jgi:hypothetical protein